MPPTVILGYNILHHAALTTYLCSHFMHADKDKLAFQMKRYGKFNIKLKRHMKETACFPNRTEI